MNLDLNGKTALITAATSGIGLATAESLAAEGVHVWLNGRSQGRLDAAVSAVNQKVPGRDWRPWLEMSLRRKVSNLSLTQ